MYLKNLTECQVIGILMKNRKKKKKGKTEKLTTFPWLRVRMQCALAAKVPWAGPPSHVQVEESMTLVA